MGRGCVQGFRGHQTGAGWGRARGVAAWWDVEGGQVRNLMLLPVGQGLPGGSISPLPCLARFRQTGPLHKHVPRADSRGAKGAGRARGRGGGNDGEERGGLTSTCLRVDGGQGWGRRGGERTHPLLDEPGPGGGRGEQQQCGGGR